MLYAVVKYVSAVDSKMKSASSRVSFVNYTSTTPLASSAAAWTLNSFTSYTALKIVVTAPEAFKINTELVVTLYAMKAAPSTNPSIFIDPELTVS